MTVITDEPTSESPPARSGQRRQRPPGPGLPWRLLLVVIVVVGLVAGAAHLKDLLPSLPNPFTKKTVDRSQPAVLRALEDLSEYRAAGGYFQVIIDLEEDAKYLPSFVRGERTLFVATGTVDAAVDFSALTGDGVAVSDDRRRVELSLPPPRLTEARVDPGRSHVVSRERGLIDRLGSVLSDSPTGERELYLLAEKKLHDAAQEGDILGRAEVNVKAMLESMMRSLGFTEVTVRFTPPKG